MERGNGFKLVATNNAARELGNASRVLVVEDDGIVAADIAGALEKFGYGLAGRAASGEEALVKAEELRPDLILMDVRLRGALDGITAAHQIRKRFSIPVVFLTASSDRSTIQRALVTGPLGYLVKPFREVELSAAIELALARHRAEVAFREREAHLSSMSVVDDLTQVHNRRGFLALAEKQFALSRRTGQPLGLFFMDLDGLKTINDRLGHQAGDQAIFEAARLLIQTFRESDIVARLSGDEFAVLGMGIGESEAEQLVERLRAKLSRLNCSNQLPFILEMSVGFAMRECDADETLDSFIARADVSMYINKRARREMR